MGLSVDLLRPMEGVGLEVEETETNDVELLDEVEDAVCEEDTEDAGGMSDDTGA